jgi:dienelactone hydrolase
MPQERVLLRATTEDDGGRRWSSCAEFRADAKGKIDLASSKPFSGDYRGLDAMGLFWSMHLAKSQANGSALFEKNGTGPHCVAISAEVSGRVVARTTIERIFIAPGTAIRDCTAGEDSRSTIGRLFIPPGSGRHPVVIVLGGSGGGFDVDKAAVLSRHGLATFALAYFGMPPLPAWLNRIPLEYFAAALDWLRSQPEVNTSRVGVLGVSRGAELALLLGATFPMIGAVAAYAPSAIAWAAGGRDKQSGEPIPSWTLGDSPIPFAPLPLRRFMLKSAIPVVGLRRSVMFRNLFRAGLRNRIAVKSAIIPVERIGGPLLLISGGDDHVWPATQMSKMIVERLRKHDFRHPVEHLNFPRAGHMLRYPHLPTTSRRSWNKHLRNARFSFGGSAEADAEAQSAAWKKTIEFFKANL